MLAVHKSLETRDLLPAEHLVDKGYTDAGVLIDSQRDYGVSVIGPVADDPSWQARADMGSTNSGSGSTGIGIRDLSGRQAEHLMAAENQSEERDPGRGAVLRPGLHALSVALPLHPVQTRTAHPRVAVP